MILKYIIYFFIFFHINKLKCINIDIVPGNITLYPTDVGGYCNFQRYIITNDPNGVFGITNFNDGVVTEIAQYNDNSPNSKIYQISFNKSEIEQHGIVEFNVNSNDGNSSLVQLNWHCLSNYYPLPITDFDSYFIYFDYSESRTVYVAYYNLTLQNTNQKLLLSCDMKPYFECNTIIVTPEILKLTFMIIPPDPTELNSAIDISMPNIIITDWLGKNTSLSIPASLITSNCNEPSTTPDVTYNDWDGNGNELFNVNLKFINSPPSFQNCFQFIYKHNVDNITSTNIITRSVFTSSTIPVSSSSISINYTLYSSSIMNDQSIWTLSYLKGSILQSTELYLPISSFLSYDKKSTNLKKSLNNQSNPASNSISSVYSSSSSSSSSSNSHSSNSYSSTIGTSSITVTYLSAHSSSSSSSNSIGSTNTGNGNTSIGNTSIGNSLLSSITDSTTTSSSSTTTQPQPQPPFPEESPTSEPPVIESPTLEPPVIESPTSEPPVIEPPITGPPNVFQNCLNGYENRLFDFNVFSYKSDVHKITIQVGDNAGIFKISIQGLDKMQLTTINRIQGDSCLGTYVLIYSSFKPASDSSYQIIIENILNVQTTYYSGNYYSTSPEVRKLPNYLPPYYPISINDIVDFKFNNNLLDLSNSSVGVIAYLKLIPLYDRIAEVILTLDRPWDDKPTFKSKWDVRTEQYRFDILVPGRLNTGDLQYSFQYPSTNIDWTTLMSKFGIKAGLDLRSTISHQIGPIINSLSPYPSSLVNISYTNTWNTEMIGFKFEITSVNGFKEGVVILKNNHGFQNQFKITANSKSEYEVLLPFSSTCADTVLIFDVDYLMDEFNNKWSFDSLSTIPFNNRILSIKCHSPTIDTSPPIFINHTIYIPPDNYENKPITITTEYSDTGSGILLQSPQILIISSRGYDDLTVLSSDITKLKYNTKYWFSFYLPYGYGYPGGVYYQFKPIYDNQYNQSPETPSNPFPPVELSTNILTISYVSSITNLGGLLYISGYNLIIPDSFTQVYVDIFDGRFYQPIDHQEYNSTMLLSIYVEYSSPFKIYCKRDDQYDSNEIIVRPSYDYDQPTKDPIPLCAGVPQCGNPGNGQCLPTGCKCFSPWTGNDCLSKPIIVPQPDPNTTHPVVNIDYISNDLPNGKIIQFESHISLLGLVEKDYLGDVKEEFFDLKWHFTNISNSTHTQFLYSTNFTKNTTKISSEDTLIHGIHDVSPEIVVTQIEVTTEWFTTGKTIVFANETIEIAPSTMKYNIKIKNYPFKSYLHTLQVVMCASAQTPDDGSESCSLQEFGPSSQNTDIQYLKLQINTQSFYARFLKKALLDDEVSMIYPEILPSDNAHSNSTMKSSLIGITIPYFNNEAILEHDYSLLADTNSPLPNKMNSECSNILIESSEELVKNDKAIAIIVASVGCSVVLLLSALYYIYKRKQMFKSIKKLSEKYGKGRRSSISLS